MEGTESQEVESLEFSSLVTNSNVITVWEDEGLSLGVSYTYIVPDVSIQAENAPESDIHIKMENEEYQEFEPLEYSNSNTQLYSDIQFTSPEQHKQPTEPNPVLKDEIQIKSEDPCVDLGISFPDAINPEIEPKNELSSMGQEQDRDEYNTQAAAYRCSLCHEAFHSQSQQRKHLVTPEHQKKQQDRMQLLQQHLNSLHNLNYLAMSRTKRISTNSNAEEGSEMELDSQNQSCMGQSEQNREKLEHGNSENSLAPKVKQYCRRFKCVHCPASFSKQKVLIKHTGRKHRDKLPYKCYSCNISCAALSQFNKHLETRKHQNKQMMSHDDGLCDKNPTIQLLKKPKHNDQMPKRKPLKLFSCEVCNKKFNYERNLIVHKKTIHGMDREMFTCGLCKKIFISEKGFKYHMHHFHTNSENTVSCDLCNEEVSSQRCLVIHKRMIHNIETQMLFCEMCNKTFSQRQNLREHKRTIHNGDREIFTCSICNKEMLTRSGLKSHMKKIHKTEEPQMYFNCSECGFQYGSIKSLDYHIKRTHSKVTIFNCEICNMKYTTEFWLKKHIQSVHKTNEDYAGNVEQSISTGTTLNTETNDFETNENCAENVEQSISTGTTTNTETNVDFETNENCAENVEQSISTETSPNTETVNDFETRPNENCAENVEKSNSTGTITIETNDKTKTNEVCAKNGNELTFVCSNEFTSKNELVLHGRSKEHKNACSICARTFKYPQSLRKHMELHNVTHSCSYCNEAFDTRKMLKAHVNQTHDTEKKVCHLCGVLTLNLNAHFRNVHNDVRPFKCSFCDLKFKLLGTLNIHEQKHSDFRPFECKICDAKFHQRTELNKHMVRKHSSDNQFASKSNKLRYKLKTNFPCTLCPKEFKTLDNFKYHMFTHTNEAAYECPICKVRFPHTKILSQHNREVHAENLKFECKICSKRFRYEGNLHQHEETHGNSDNGLIRWATVNLKGKYECEICQKEISTKNNFIKHMSNVHNTSDEDFRCEICFKIFRTKDSLRGHHASVHDVKRHVCSICDKHYSAPYLLRIHERTHTNERPFLCEICKKGFVSLSNLKGHMDSHSDERKHQCPICFKLFKANRHMIFHKKKVHDQNEASVECKICGESVKTYSLKNHYKLQHAEQIFACDLCGNAYLHKTNLIWHINHHHKESPSKV